MPLAYVNKAPGVYINEINEPGPIAGVSTSTAAFVGPAQSGQSGKPTQLTNFTQFKQQFGDVMENFFVGHSVKGFFENGGANCYFVRVGSSATASCTLEDQTGAPALKVIAKAAGEAWNRIKVEVKEASLLSDGKVYRAAAKLVEAKKDGKQATLSDPQDAAKFKKGNVVRIANNQSPQIVTIDEIKDGTITFAESLSDNYDGGNIRIADLAVGTVRIRVDKTDGMEKGSYVVVTQQKQGSAATMDKLVVSEVDGTNKFVTFQSGLSSSYPMAETDPPVTIKTVEFTITVETPAGLANAGSQPFANLSMDSGHSRFVEKITNTANNVVITLVQGTSTAPPNNMPRSGTYQLNGSTTDDYNECH